MWIIKMKKKNILIVAVIFTIFNLVSLISATCGDGIIKIGVEQCDDGNIVNGDGCSSQCQIEKRCGNCIVEPGEQCDDGNTVSGDGCSSQCKIERCGNGLVDVGEQCDDGNNISGDGCSSQCKIEKRCGNCLIEYGEQCDDGNSVNTDSCTNLCKIAFCGDGIVKTGWEQCDDGNINNFDSCSNDCTLNECVMNLTKIDSPDPVTPGSTLKYTLTLKNIGTADCTGGGVLLKEYYPSLTSYLNASPAPTSGNDLWNFGTIHPCESLQVNITMLVSSSSVPCSTLTNKACFWTVEYNRWVCIEENTSITCSPAPLCGDGIVNQANETCDDGNTNNNDGCSNQCQTINCYNNSQCGTSYNNKFCSGTNFVYNITQFTCNNPGTANSYCSNTTNKTSISCGDASSYLICQDNDVYNETISPLCINGGLCSTSNTSQFVSDCGNPSSSLECVGNNMTNITINRGCSAGSCSNTGTEYTIKQCPTGNSTIIYCVGNKSITNTTTFLGCSSASCLNQTQTSQIFCEFGCIDGICQNRTTYCGDGIINQANETCDEGVNNGNVCVPVYEGSCQYCNSTCSSITLYGPFCGDNVKNSPYEECDGLDGVGIHQSCSQECKLICLPFCGDGIINNGEECDDGNSMNGDGCSSNCTIEKQICEHDVGVRFSYSNSVGTGIAIKPVNGSWLLDDPEELTKGTNYTIKYFVDNKIENSSNFIHVVAKVGNKTLADYNTSINVYHSKEVSLNISELGYKDYNITVFVEKINEQDCNTTDNFAWREIIIIPQCGNGFLDIGEQCDDGNSVNGDGCNSQCHIEICGNGVVDLGEQCDDGNTNNSDTCTNTCKIGSCGDGIIQIGEQCDEGIDNGNVCVPVYEGSCQYCNSTCSSITLYGPFCGDGIIKIGVEECDDGNIINGDGCSANCEKEKECTKNTDCSDGLFCNGEEICNQDYECASGTPPQIDDELFCTSDVCDESTDTVLHTSLNVSDGIACTIDTCDEQLNKIVHQPNDDYCDNGLFCDGNEYCNPQMGCKSGIAVDCSGFNLLEIKKCNNNPDSNPFTLDFAPGFTSVCSEKTDSCTVGTYQFTHTCDTNMCDAECELGETQSVECGTDIGECEFGEIVLDCTRDCEWESDSRKVCMGGVNPTTEICDGKDNNCNGEIDEGFLNDFDRLSYSSRNTGDIISLDEYSNFTEERVDFFHGNIYQRDGEYFGDGSMYARGTASDGTKVQLNVKFTVVGLIEIDCEKITWRNSARGTYWIYGTGTKEVKYDYIDITYYFATGKIDAVGVGDVDFEFKDIINTRI